MTPGLECAPAPLVGAEGFGSLGSDTACGFADLDVAGRAFARFPDTGVTRGVGLQRARLELGVRTVDDVQLRFGLLEARTGGPDGYIGVDGEAFVPVLQIAEARWDWRATGLAVAAGIVDDPWTMTVQGAWNRREVAGPMVTDQGFTTRSDEGGWLSWSGPDRIVTTTAAVLAGEGANTRDRNDGVDLSGLVVVRPLAVRGGELQPELALYARDGSTGLLSARDHRLAGALLVHHPWVVGGVDGLLGWGLDGDGALLPAGLSGWARAGDRAPLVAWARGDLAWADRTEGASRETVVLLGGGPRFPFGETQPKLAVVVGYEARRYEPDAAPIAGTERVAGSDLVFVQVGSRVLVAVPFPTSAR